MTKTKKLESKQKQQEKQATEKLKKGDIIERYNMLNQVLNLSGRTLLYKRDRNLTKLAALASDGKDLSFSKRFPLSDDYKEYQKRQKELLEKLSGGKTKNVTNPATGQQQEVYDVNIQSKEYKDAVKALDVEFADAIEKFKSDQEAYIDFLNEDFEEDIQFLYVTLDEVPENISEKAFTAISWMIIDE